MSEALLPPHSVETEEAVLGSILIDPEAMLRVASFLAPEHFYVLKHQWVYRAMLQLHERREPIDLLTVTRELANAGHLDEIGGEAFIAYLTSTVPTALNVEAYARAVESLAIRRRMIAAASEIARTAYDQSLTIEQVIEKSEATLFDVTEKHGERHMVTMRKAVSDFYERLEYLHEHRDEPLGIPTGYPDLDRLTGGLQKGDLIIIAARPGVGKTSLMLNIAHNAAFKHRQRVAIFSLEMSIEQLTQRFIASSSGIDAQRLRIADLRDEEFGVLTRVATQLAELPIFLDDTPSLSPLALRTKARRLYQEHGLDLIIVDYLQLMQGEGFSRGDNRVQEISYISRALKNLARELNVPLVAGSQLSRLVEHRSDKRPVLSDLRESGSIEQDSDIVMFIYRDELYNENTEYKNIAEIIVAKNRNGPTGKVMLFFDKRLTSFKNLARERIEL